MSNARTHIREPIEGVCLVGKTFQGGCQRRVVQGVLALHRGLPQVGIGAERASEVGAGQAGGLHRLPSVREHLSRSRHHGEGG